jgi:hypothetical protein
VTFSPDWSRAFPNQPATQAVEALCAAWDFYAQRRRADFNELTKEPGLTKLLAAYVEWVTAPALGLLGMWSAESVTSAIDDTTGALIQERRTDIAYGWNDDASRQRLQLVFEFKRLGKQKRHRDHYLGANGLGRFVTGIYSKGQPTAVMVGVLLDPEPDVLPQLREAFADSSVASRLQLRVAADGMPLQRPSTTFARADFDTTHDRPPNLAPSHGFIRVAHVFLEFGYPTRTTKR